MRYQAEVRITLKPTVNDPQGNAVLSGLHTLGFASVEAVRVGRYVTVVVDATDEGDAKRQVDSMCDKLLANPVIESYETAITPA